MRKIVVGITGASGAVYARQLLEKLRAQAAVEAAVVCTGCGEQVFRHELGDEAFAAIPFRRYAINDFHAPFASGSSGFDTMIVAPCSMGSLARIANGVSNDLLARAADVMLKERRRLILVTRETPLNLIHLRNMLQIAEAGGIICPASPSFYHRPATTEAAVETVVNRVLQLAGLEQDGKKWGD
jgi:4-hydroxy-3-polyprenylbenzoate decarboxylase